MTKNNTVLKPIAFKAFKALFEAAGINSVRFFLNGVLIDHEKGNVVATNGHVLAVISGCVAKTGKKEDNRWLSRDVLKTLSGCLTPSARIAFNESGHITYSKKGYFGKGSETSGLRYDAYKTAKGMICESTDPKSIDYANAFPDYRKVMHVDTPRDEFSWLSPVYLFAWYKIAEALGWEKPYPQVTPGGRNVEMDHFGQATRLLLDGGDDDELATFDFYIMPIDNTPSMVPVKEGR